MLDALYSNLFRWRQPLQLPRLAASWLMWAILALIAAMRLGAAFGLGGLGVFFAALGLLGVFGLGWLWLGAFAHLLAALMGGKATGSESMAALSTAFWPLILTAPIEAAASWLGSGAEVLELGLGVWVAVGLVRAIRATHRLGWGRSILCLVGTGVVGFVALGVAVALPFALLVLAIA